MPIVSGSTVIRGSRGTPVAQDDNDYLITVIKGMYNGNLETVALDQDHAIKAVLYDPVDDWNKTQTIGLNELATRLGSLQGFDNRGRLLWSDDFETPELKWNVITTASATLALSNAVAHKGDGSIRIHIPAWSNSSATLSKTFYHPLSGIFGVEMAWSCSSILWNHLQLGLIIYDGTTRWNYYIDLLGAARTFFMREHGVGNRGVGTMTYENNDLNFWHLWKLVINTTSERIIRVMVDGIEFDPSAYEVEHAADASDPHIDAHIYVQNTGAVMTLHVDNFILTHMEPV